MIRRTSLAALAAALLLPATAGLSAADPTDPPDRVCAGSTCVGSVKEKEKKVTETTTETEGDPGAHEDPGTRPSPTGPTQPSEPKKYDREAELEKWREQDPGAFNPITGQPTGVPPCGILVVPMVYEACEDETTNDAPGGTVTTVTIEEVISMAKLTLPKPEMGSAPCTGAGCKGTVGVPVWFWLEGNQWKTYSDSASAGGLTVTVSAKPSKVVWRLGDGQSVTCTSAGTPYRSSMGWATSPDCGLPHGYSTPGDYTATASITYDVTLSGDAAGTDTVTTTSSVDLVVGEYQADTTRH